MGWLNDWQFRIEITIDANQFDSNLTHFPLGIHLSASCGQSSQDVSAIFDELTSDANRFKIAVTKADGETQIYVEIESWDDVAEQAWLHVAKSDLTFSSTGDTTLFIYYDSTKPDNTAWVGDAGSVVAQNVWDSFFELVMHFAEDPTGGAGAVKDSTSNNNDGEGQNMEAGDRQDLGFGKGYDFDGTDEYVSIPDDDTLSFGDETDDDPMTVEAYVNPDVLANFRMAGKRASGAGEYQFMFNVTPSILFYQFDNTTSNYQYAIGPGTGQGEWHHWAGTYDGGGEEAGVDVLKDGVSVKTAGVEGGTYLAMHNFSQVLEVGAITGLGSNKYANGKFSEFRLSRVVRVTAWLRATFETLEDNTNTFGTEELYVSSSSSSASKASKSSASSSSKSSLPSISSASISSASSFSSSASLSSASLSSASSFSSMSSFSSLSSRSSSSALKVLGAHAWEGAIAEQAIHANPAAMGLFERFDILNSLSPVIKKILAEKLTISGDPVQAILAILGEISDKDIVRQILAQLGTIGDLDVTFPTVDYDIFLDVSSPGNSIKDRVTTCRVIMSEAHVHNQVEIESIDRMLWTEADPNILAGEPRIEVHIGARVMKFLLETREGNETRFVIWGRSISARDDSPYAAPIDYEATTPTAASDIADTFITVNNVDWQVPEWVLPAQFQFDGDPVVGLQSLADIIGAIVRSKDDGTLLVRRRFSVRPVDMPVATPDANYDRVTNLLQLTQAVDKGTGYNEIEVLGHSLSTELPQLAVEESSPEKGTDVHVRAYWPIDVPASVQQLVTDGIIVDLGEATDTFEEDAVFKESRAVIGKPIESLTSTVWQGVDGGTPSFDLRSRDLTITVEEFAVATVTYSSRYVRYRLSQHFVDLLLAAVGFDELQTVAVRVKMLDGGNAAPALAEGDITDQATAVEAGTAWLDANRYDKKRLTIRVPYDAGAIDGNLAYVNNAEVGAIGIFHIEEVTILMAGPQVVEELEVVQCQV